MANALYAHAKQAALAGGLDLDGLLHGTFVQAVLVRTGAGHYVVDLANHQTLADIAAGDRIATSGALLGVSIALGVFSAVNVTLPNVPAGPPDAALVLYSTNPVGGATLLLEYRDADANLPVTPNGGGIQLVWDTGANKIFAL